MADFTITTSSSTYMPTISAMWSVQNNGGQSATAVLRLFYGTSVASGTVLGQGSNTSVPAGTTTSLSLNVTDSVARSVPGTYSYTLAIIGAGVVVASSTFTVAINSSSTSGGGGTTTYTPQYAVGTEFDTSTNNSSPLSLGVVKITSIGGTSSTPTYSLTNVYNGTVTVVDAQTADGYVADGYWSVV